MMRSGRFVLFGIIPRTWGIDPNRIGILGFSAGGHLSATASTLFDAGNPSAADAIERSAAGQMPPFWSMR